MASTADLSRVIRAWPKLSDDLRRAVLAILDVADTAFHEPVPRSSTQPHRPTKNGLATTDEAAAYIGISPRTLEAWRGHGLMALPFIRIGGNKRGPVRYRIADLNAYLERNVRTHT